MREHSEGRVRCEREGARVITSCDCCEVSIGIVFESGFCWWGVEASMDRRNSR